MELPIPWKKTSLDNNYHVAISRLKSLEVSLEKKSLRKKYDEAIQVMLEKNYAEIIPNQDMYNNQNCRIWYLPHHPVPKKDNSIRIVFDCASKFRGYSLNDCAYQGPNLNNKLNNVLMRFRRYHYAMTADISSMYNQVKVPLVDRDALRFFVAP